MNFDRAHCTKVVLRDVFYTVGIWFCLLFMQIFTNTPYSWLIVVVGIGSLFGFGFIQDSLEKDHKSTYAIMLFTTEPFNPKMLREFLASIGAFIPGKQQPYIGRLSYPEGYIWISNPTKILTKVHKRLSQRHAEWSAQYEEYQAKLRAHLGGEVGTILFLSILHAKDVRTGERAVMEFIQCFSQHYPCIVEDSDGNLLTSQEMREALDKNVLTLGFQKHIAGESATNKA